MTNATPGPVEVTQADRELYLKLGIFHTCEDRMILAGWADESPEMQLLARHRIEAARPVQSELVEALVEARSGLCAYTGGPDGACGHTVAKIDALVAKATGDGL